MWDSACRRSTWSISRTPSSVVSSPGNGSLIADALQQCTQDSKQALVDLPEDEDWLLGEWLVRSLEAFADDGEGWIGFHVWSLEVFLENERAQAPYQLIGSVERFAPRKTDPVWSSPTVCTRYLCRRVSPVVETNPIGATRKSCCPLSTELLQMLNDVGAPARVRLCDWRSGMRSSILPSRSLQLSTRQSRVTGFCRCLPVPNPFGKTVG